MPPRLEENIHFYSELPRDRNVASLYRDGYVIFRWDNRRTYPLIAECLKGKVDMSEFTNVFSEYKYYKINKKLTSLGLPPLVRNILSAFEMHLKHKKVFYSYSFLKETERLVKNYKNFLQNKKKISFFRQETVDQWWDHKIKTRIPLMKHQKIGVMQLLTLDSFGLLWDPGTGKTATVTIAAQEMLLRNKIDKVLLFCPATIRTQWESEIKLFQSTSDIIKPIIITTDNIDKLSDQNYNFFIMTYESTLNQIERYVGITDDRTMVVLDESTRIKNSSKRTKKILKLSKLTNHKIIMTGTISSERAEDVYYQIKFLDLGERFGSTKDSFISTYFDRDGYRKNLKDGSAEKISDEIFDISSRFKREDVIDIPPFTNRIVTVRMIEKQRKLYDKVCEDIVAELEGGEEIVTEINIVKLLRCRQICSGFIGIRTQDEDHKMKTHNHELENPKGERLKQLIIESVENRIPTVLWVQWMYELEYIASYLDTIGTSYGTVHGQVSPKNKDKACSDFQDRNILFLLANIRTLQYGKNLQTGAREIYFSPTYSYNDKKQSEDRLLRLGQKNKVEIINLICEDSIEVSVYNTLCAKKELSSIINKDNVRGVLGGNM